LVSVIAGVRVDSNSDGWIGHPSPAEDGNLELIVARKDEGIEGTISGRSVGGLGRSVTIGGAGNTGAARLTATRRESPRDTRTLVLFVGTMTGSLVYTAADATTVSCSEGQVVLTIVINAPLP
jgi:hypothetical protein